jgi:hypothetical protein
MMQDNFLPRRPIFWRSLEGSSVGTTASEPIPAVFLPRVTDYSLLTVASANCMIPALEDRLCLDQCPG